MYWGQVAVEVQTPFLFCHPLSPLFALHKVVALLPFFLFVLRQEVPSLFIVQFFPFLFPFFRRTARNLPFFLFFPPSPSVTACSFSACDRLAREKGAEGNRLPSPSLADAHSDSSFFPPSPGSTVASEQKNPFFFPRSGGRAFFSFIGIDRSCGACRRSRTAGFPFSFFFLSNTRKPSRPLSFLRPLRASFSAFFFFFPRGGGIPLFLGPGEVGDGCDVFFFSFFSPIPSFKKFRCGRVTAGSSPLFPPAVRKSVFLFGSEGLPVYSR